MWPHDVSEPTINDVDAVMAVSGPVDPGKVAVVSTRRLIFLALACGMAILLASAIQLFQIIT